MFFFYKFYKSASPTRIKALLHAHAHKAYYVFFWLFKIKLSLLLLYLSWRIIFDSLIYSYDKRIVPTTKLIFINVIRFGVTQIFTSQKLPKCQKWMQQRENYARISINSVPLVCCFRLRLPGIMLTRIIFALRIYTHIFSYFI